MFFFCYSEKQTIFLLMFFISLFCFFSPFEENESKTKMVVEKHVTRQSLTQSPAGQKARGFWTRDWVLCAGNQWEQASFFFQVHTTECELGALA